MFRSTRTILKILKRTEDRLDSVEALLASEITWKAVAEEQKDLIKDLMNRLMSKDFKELQIYGTGESQVTVETPVYVPEADDDNAGMVIESETKS